MPSKIDVSVVIVTYKSEEYIKGLLDSIAQSSSKVKLEVVVVDNYLADRSLEIAASHKLKPKTIKSTENVGLARAVNQAISYTRGEYIFLINPDSRLVRDGLYKLYQFASSKSPLGAVVPKLTYIDGSIQPSVFYLPSIANAIKAYFLNQKKYFGKYVPKGKTPQIEGAVMAAFMIPRSTINLVGNLDERFFLYYEDIEYCRRLKQYKLPIYYYSGAVVRHVHGASGDFKRHLDSPLARSAQIYHGTFYSHLLNFVLWLGQKYQKVLKIRAKL